MNLPDTQNSLQHLWDTCFDGGRNCALYKESDKGPQDIETRVREWLDELDEAPIPYVDGHSYVSLSKSDVINMIFSALYSPERAFARLTTSLAEGMSGNFTSIYEGLERPKEDSSCQLGGDYKYTWNKDVLSTVACGDGDSQRHLKARDLQEHVNNLTAISPDFGALWASIRATCTGWRFRAKYNFAGPFVTPQPDSSLKKGIPAAPILFASSRYDPVTPLINARWAAAEHPGSTVLLQENVGHGSLYSPGKCREDFIKKYFETGELPEEEVVCQPDCTPFQDCHRSDARMNDARSNWVSGWKAPLEIF